MTGSTGDMDYSSRWGVQELSNKGLTQALVCVANAPEAKEGVKQRRRDLYCLKNANGQTIVLTK